MKAERNTDFTEDIRQIFSLYVNQLKCLFPCGFAPCLNSLMRNKVVKSRFVILSTFWLHFFTNLRAWVHLGYTFWLFHKRAIPRLQMVCRLKHQVIETDLPNCIVSMMGLDQGQTHWLNQRRGTWIERVLFIGLVSICLNICFSIGDSDWLAIYSICKWKKVASQQNHCWDPHKRNGRNAKNHWSRLE